MSSSVRAVINMMSFVVGVLLAFVAAAAGRDFWGWLPMISRVVLGRGVMALPRLERSATRVRLERRLADDFDDRRLSGLVWSIASAATCIWRGGKARRASTMGRRSARSWAVIWAAMVAACTGLVASDVLRMPLGGALLVGVSAGGASAALDLSAIARVDRAGMTRPFGGFGPRLCLGVTLGALLVTPIMLLLFHREIQTRVMVDRQLQIEHVRQRLADAGRGEIARLMVERRRLDARLRMALELPTDRRVATFRLYADEQWRVDASLHAAMADLRRRQDISARAISRAPIGVLEQVRALDHVRAETPQLQLFALMLVALVCGLDMLPSAMVAAGATASRRARRR